MPVFGRESLFFSPRHREDNFYASHRPTRTQADIGTFAQDTVKAYEMYCASKACPSISCPPQPASARTLPCSLRESLERAHKENTLSTAQRTGKILNLRFDPWSTLWRELFSASPGKQNSSLRSLRLCGEEGSTHTGSALSSPFSSACTLRRQ